MFTHYRKLVAYGKQVAKLFIALPLFILTLEICARVDDSIRYDAPFFCDYTYRNMLVSRDEHGTTGRPNGRFQKWSLNSFGFRNDETGLRKEPGTIRIACLGASETFGYYERPGGEWPAQLADILRSSEGSPYEVMNTAFPGRLLRSNIVHLKERVLKFKPDIVILYQLNFSYMDPKFEPRRTERPQSVSTRISRAGVKRPSLSLRVKPKIRECIKKITPTALQERYRRYKGLKQLREIRIMRGYTQLVDTASPSRLQLMKEDMEIFHDLCKTHDAELVVGTSAVCLTEENMIEGWRYMPYLTEQGFTEGAPKFNQALAELADEKQFTCVDIATLVPSDNVHMADYVHFADKGARIVAQAFAEAVFAMEHQADYSVVGSEEKGWEARGQSPNSRISTDRHAGIASFRGK